MERNVAGNVSIFAFDYATGAPKTGDNANITMFLGNSTAGFLTPQPLGNATITQIDSANYPGIYRAQLTAGETNYPEITLGGKSSTANVAIVPQRITLTPANFSLNSLDGSGRVLLQPAQSNITANIVGTWTGSLTGSVGSVTGAVGSVTGAVGSVTGNVAAVTGNVGGTLITNGDKTGYSLASSQTFNMTGNVSGSVGSVTGAVGSVTGAVGSVTGLTAAYIDVALSTRASTANLAITDGNVSTILGQTGTTGVVVISTSRPSVRKNTALANFQILMTDSTNHNPVTGKTVTVQRAIDGGSLANGTLSAVTEMSNGLYRFDFGAGDLNGTTIVVRCTATGADDLVFTFVTSP